jgi:hypothetical protein
MPEDRGDQGAAGPDEARVAAVLDQLRAGVRQRRAELATLAPAGDGGDPLGGGASADVRARLLQLREGEFVREPVPVSHRPGWGRWIILARKAGYKLFGRWLVRPLLDQQNAYNQAVSASLQELMENEERLRRQVRDLAARLDAIRESSERHGAGGSGDSGRSGGAGNP